MANGSWQWTGKIPSVFVSREDVRRHFCSNCGTPIAYESDKYPGEIHFYTAALENTAGFEPRGHVHYDEHLPWFDTSDNLKRIGTVGE